MTVGDAVIFAIAFVVFLIIGSNPVVAFAVICAGLGFAWKAAQEVAR